MIKKSFGYCAYDKSKNLFLIRFGIIKFRVTLNLVKFISKFFPFIFKILDFVLPKNKRKIVFNSYPDYSDNPYAFYKYMKENFSNDYELIWITKALDLKGKNVKSYKMFSFKGIYSIFTAKYIVSSHANKFLDFVNNKRHININLWHGMPLKTLGMCEKIINKNIKRRYKNLGKNSYSFATSDLFKLSLIPCFNANYFNIFITGQPRTDLIWNEENSQKLENLFNFSKYDKVIFYMPTYKENPNARVKQTNVKYENIFYFSDYNEKSFVKYLEDNNILFIMKPHPFDEEFYEKNIDTIPKSENFKIIFNNIFTDNDIYSYEMFKYVDLMISDFSSVTIDYLILNRPVIYLTNLTESYNNIRGMILPDNTNLYMPGAVVNNMEILLKELDENLYKDSYKSAREQIIPLMHKYCDNKASERIFEIMKGL